MSKGCFSLLDEIGEGERTRLACCSRRLAENLLRPDHSLLCEMRAFEPAETAALLNPIYTITYQSRLTPVPVRP